MREAARDEHEMEKDIHLIQIHYIPLHILTNLTSDLNTTSCLVLRFHAPKHNNTNENK